MRILAITTLRNEASFLLDWLAYHRCIGFTDFLIFTNHCDDGTAQMADRLQTLGLAQHLPNPAPWPEGPQWAAMKQAEKHPLFAQADWVMVLDIDEYLCLHHGDGTLASLLGSYPEYDAFPMTWRLFGNNGVTALEDRPIPQIFTRCAPRVMHWPWRALMVKTLFRRASFAKLGVHRPHHPQGLPRWSDPDLGERIFSRPGRDPYGLGQVNHYALGAMESYILKSDRGRANRKASTADMAYWCARNFDTVEDLRLARFDYDAERTALFADPLLYGLHQTSMSWRRHRFAELMREESNRSLYGNLLMTPSSRILSAQEAASIRHFGLR